MERSISITLSSIASVVQVVILVWAFLAESFRDVMLYYTFVTINPLIGGAFAFGVLAVLAAIRWEHLPETTGTGIALGLAVINLLVVTIWTFTGRVDVFLARGWAFPAQRWVLVGVSTVIVLGVSLHARTLGLTEAVDDSTY